MSGDAESLINEDLPTIAEDLVVTKYKMAAEIANREYRIPLLPPSQCGSSFSKAPYHLASRGLSKGTLKGVMDMCTPGKDIWQILQRLWREGKTS